MGLFMVSLAMSAQSQLVINNTNGSKEKVSLDKRPTVTFSTYGEKVKVSYDGKQKELDVKNIQVEGVKDGSGEMAIIDLDGDKVMIPLSRLKSISQASFESEADLLPKVISQNPAVSIYYEALKVTHMDDSLKHYIDETYTWASDKDRIDSCTWTNDKLCIPVAKGLDGSGGEYDNVAYPEKRYFNYTAFLVPDSVLKEKYGITNLDGLRKKAHELYDPMFPEDKDVTDETNRCNALNRFISYHLLPIFGQYYTLTAYDGGSGNLQYNFDRRKADITDWYETLMPHSIMKFSFPSGSQAGLYVNRRSVQHHEDDMGVLIRGAKVATYKEYELNNVAINGAYHYIDDIVAYDETMQKVVCDDRIRVEATTLSPDFMTRLTDGQTARGHYWRNGERYSSPVNSGVAASNRNRSVGFKPGFTRNIKMTPNTHMHVRGRSLWFWSYEGDEVIFKGRYDATIKLPPVPAGTYEVRLMTCIGFGTRGVNNLYIDNTLVGENVNFRPGGRTSFGWKSDGELGDEEAIAAFDKEIHAKGWMKGPGDYYPGQRAAFDASSVPMRGLDNTVRRVVGTFETDGKSDHYLRIQQMLDSDNNEFPLDFIELIPIGRIETENIY